MINLLSELAEIEELVRTNRTSVARERLREFVLPKRAESSLTERFCDLLRRCGYADRALRILSPLVLKRHELRKVPTRLVLSYAQCLIAVNATLSAQRLLTANDLDEHPDAFGLRAQLRMCNWDYAGALPLWVAYLKTLDRNSYASYVARLNLAACRVSIENSDLVIEEIQNLRRELRERGFERLIFNSTELEIQALCDLGRTQEAQELAHQQSQNGSSRLLLDSMYLEKWTEIADLEKGSAKAASNLKNLRSRAAGGGYSELRRDIDFRLASYEKQADALNFLYFATPYESFQKRFESLDWYQLPKECVWEIGGKGRIFHFNLEEWVASHDYSLPARLLAAFFRDGYRAPSQIEIFDLIYTDSIYNPESSPLAVHQLLHRLRKLIAKENLPLVIEFDGAGFSLRATAGRVLVKLNQHADRLASQTRVELRALELASSVAETTEVTARSIAEELNVTPRMAQILIKDWLSEGKLSKHGAGRATRYQWRVPQEQRQWAQTEKHA